MITRRVLPYVVIPLVVFAAYGRSLDNFWIKDDLNLHLISDTLDVNWSRLKPFLWPSHMVSDQYWRPLPILLGFLEYSLWNIEPFAYHVTNTLLHALAGILVYFFVRRFAAGCGPSVEPMAWSSALLFVLNPINPEAVIWITQRMVLLCTIFSLSALICWHRGATENSSRPRLYGRMFWIFGIFCKEVAATLPGVFFVVDLLYGPAGSTLRSRLSWAIRRAVPNALIVVAYMTCRWVIFGRAFSIKYGGLEPADYAREFRVFERLPESLEKSFLPVNEAAVGAPMVTLLPWIIGCLGSFCLVRWLLLLFVSFETRRFSAVLLMFFFLSFLPTLPIFWIDANLFNGRFFYQPGLLVGVCAMLGLLAPWRDGATIVYRKSRVFLSVVLALSFLCALLPGIAAFDEASAQITGLRDSLHALRRNDPAANPVYVVLGVPSQVKGVPTLEWNFSLLGRPPFFAPPIDTIPLLDVQVGTEQWHSQLQTRVTRDQLHPEQVTYLKAVYHPPHLVPLFSTPRIGSGQAPELIEPRNGAFITTRGTAPVFRFSSIDGAATYRLHASIDNGRQVLIFDIIPDTNAAVDANEVIWSMDRGSPHDPSLRLVWPSLQTNGLPQPAGVVWSVESLSSEGVILGRSREFQLLVM